MIKVSVIIPVYNVEKYLRRCLDSVCNQTLKDIEIICINDCSPDNSIAILNEYAKNDSRIKIIDFKENKGVSVARNAGLKKAIGEYVGFVDPDDYIDLNFYEKLYLTSNKGSVDIVKGDLVEVFPSGKKIVYPINKRIKENSKFHFIYSFSTGIYKLENIEKNNIEFPENITFGEDILFLNNNVMCANEVSVVDSLYYYYDRRSGSASSVILNGHKIDSASYVYKTILKNINKNKDISLSDYSAVHEWLVNASIGLIEKIDNKECEEKCIALIYSIFKDSKKDKTVLDYLTSKFSKIMDITKSSNQDKLKEFFIENNTVFKVFMANTRHKIKKARGV